MKQVWQIDPEFKRLSVPLSPEEERRLENSLIREGCKEPIAVWHGCILDGHKRYEICSYEEMEYETVEMDFATKDEALLWICKKHLASAKPNSAAFRYLLGKRYILERMIYKQNPEKVHITYVKKLDRVGAVCGTLAEETSMNPGTVRKYGTLALQLDQIAEKDMTMFEAILAEKIQLTYGKVIKYSEMEPAKLISTRRRLLHDDIKMRQRKPRKKSSRRREERRKGGAGDTAGDGHQGDADVRPGHGIPWAGVYDSNLDERHCPVTGQNEYRIGVRADQSAACCDPAQIGRTNHADAGGN